MHNRPAESFDDPRGQDPSNQAGLSRREVLGRAAGVLAAAVGTGLAEGLAAAATSSAPAPATQPLPLLGSRPSTARIRDEAKSLVADLRAVEVATETQIHEALLREMIEQGVQMVTQCSEPAAAWQRLLKADDVVGLKFNQIGQEALGTTPAFARQLVASLGDAGIPPGRIMLIEVPERLTRELGTRPPVFGFSGGKVAFASGEDELSALLQEVTAIINVPFLKTHHLAGMSGCLKNLSHALVRAPRRFHANGCAPYVGDIVALPQIRGKVRIHIVNALRGIFQNGPSPRLADTWQHSGLLVSFDPVATDHIGLEIINTERARRKLPPVGDAEGTVPHMAAASRTGLGTCDQDYIDHQQPQMF